MNARITTLTAVLLATLCLPSYGASETASPARSAWNKFLNSEGAGWEVDWTDSGISPVVVRPRLGAALPGWQQDHAGAASRFFAERAALFGLGRPADELRAVGERSHEGVVHVRLQQFYRGLPVLGGEYMVSASDAGDLRLVLGRVHPALGVEIVPAIAASEAPTIALRACRQPADRYETQTRLAIDPGLPGGRLVYEVRVQGKDYPESWVFLVDARDGRIVDRQDLVLNATGRGLVDLPGHLSNPAVLGTRSFTIDEPGDVATLSGPRATVSSGTGLSARSDIFDMSTGSWDFSYDPNEHGGWFDQVNVYYHLDRFLGEYLPSLGFPGLAAPVNVVVSNACNSQFTQGINEMEIGTGCNVARSSDAVYHEAGHALLYSLRIDAYGEGEALHEGFADYFACAANNDPEYGENAICGAIGCRSCATNPDSVRYPYYLQYEAHYAGEIWSGTLWDLRGRIGTITDKIALESLYYLPSRITFRMAGWALVEADFDHHGGSHASAIRRACASRGFSTAEPMTAATIAGPTTIYRNQNASYVGNVAFGQPPRSFHWTATLYFTGGSVERDLGTGSQMTMFADTASSIELRLRVTDALFHSVDANRWIRVCGAPPAGGGTLAVAIVGGPRVDVDADTLGHYEFIGVLGGGTCYDNMTFRWEMKCRDPQCVAEVVGTGPSVVVSSQRNFDLSLLVTAGSEQASASTTIRLPGMPEVSISGPDVLDIEASATYQAVVTGGDPPRTYQWSLSYPGFDGVLADTTSWVPITGVGSTMDLCLAVTTTTNLHADVACKSIGVSPPGTMHSIGAGQVSALEVSSGASGGEWAVQLSLKVAHEADVTVRAFDLAGRQVATILEGRLGTGRHGLVWPSELRRPGVYFIRASVGPQRLAKRVVVIR